MKKITDHHRGKVRSVKSEKPMRDKGQKMKGLTFNKSKARSLPC